MRALPQMHKRLACVALLVAGNCVLAMWCSLPFPLFARPSREWRSTLPLPSGDDGRSKLGPARDLQHNRKSPSRCRQPIAFSISAQIDRRDRVMRNTQTRTRKTSVTRFGLVSWSARSRAGPQMSRQPALCMPKRAAACPRQNEVGKWSRRSCLVEASSTVRRSQVLRSSGKELLSCTMYNTYVGALGGWTARMCPVPTPSSMPS